MLIAAVASSDIVIWKPPSPTTATTRSSGFPSCAPIAAGNPYPMVPAPPLDSHWRSRVDLQNWAAHIWCWPTSVAIIALDPVKRSSSAKTCCARKPPRFGYFKGCFFFQFSIFFSHSLVSSGFTRGINSSRTKAASPFTLMSG